MSDETDPKFSDPSRVTGLSAEDTHRAPEGEGARAPLAAEGADHPEFSVFDGEGNEQVVVVTENQEGKITEGTGDTSADAMKAAGKQEDRLGPGFGPPGG
jgi:hypothetical protein